MIQFNKKMKSGSSYLMGVDLKPGEKGIEVKQIAMNNIDKTKHSIQKVTFDLKNEEKGKNRGKRKNRKSFHMRTCTQT